jgi:glycosyltransferase involved in cell wall biosynthesis
MALVKTREPRLVCLMPSFKWPEDPARRVWTMKRRLAGSLGVYRRSDELYHLLQANRLSDGMVVSDFTYEMERWLAAADVVCVPHIKPHFSRTVIEAGAMRRPIVAYRVGGVEEVVSHGETGLLVPVGRVDEMASAVLGLMRDEVRRRELGLRAYEQTRHLCASDTSARQVLAVYRRLLRERCAC